jgi:hypothetical protein
MGQARNARVWLLAGALVLITSVGWLPAQTRLGGSDEHGAPVLARVFAHSADQLGTATVLLHWLGPDGRERALVRATSTELAGIGADVCLLEMEHATRPLVAAYERRAGARAVALARFRVLDDDGRQLILRVSSEQIEELGELGFAVAIIDETAAMSARVAEPVAFAAERNDQVANWIGLVSSGTLFNGVAELSGETATAVGGETVTITTRNTRATAEIKLATQLAYEQLERLGFEPYYESWTAGALQSRNVIAEVEGSIRPDEWVLLTAHIDDMPATGLAPGADDNASGSVALLAIAEILRDKRFDRSIRFALFTGEEQGLYGSKRHAQQAAARGEKIVAVLNLDMIAYDQVDGPLLELHTRTTASTSYAADSAIAQVFANAVAWYGLSSDLEIVHKPSGVTYSDHSPFWQSGFSAILAIEDEEDFNPYYHKSQDRLSRLNMAFYTSFTKAALATLAHLAGPVAADTTAPTITAGPSVSATTCVAVVNWTTDEPATSVVEVGTSLSYTHQASSPGLSTIHTVTLDGLAAGTSYHYRVASADGNGNGPTFSTDGLFATPTVTTGAINTPANVYAGAQGLLASVAPHAGSSYAWVISNGTITAGQGQSHVTFMAGEVGTLSLGVVESGADGCTLMQASALMQVTAPARPRRRLGPAE